MIIVLPEYGSGAPLQLDADDADLATLAIVPPLETTSGFYGCAWRLVSAPATVIRVRGELTDVRAQLLAARANKAATTAAIAAALATAEAYADAVVAAAISAARALSVLTASNSSGVPTGSVRYIAFGLGGGFSSVPWGCPLPACTAKTLRVKPSANSLTTATTRVTILQNGVATGLVVSIPPGSTALVSISLDVPFASGDTTSVQIDTDVGGAGSVNVVLSLSIATPLL